MMKMYPVVFSCQEVELIDEHGVATRTVAMIPSGKYQGVFARQYHLNEDYALAPIEARSRASHNQFFAAIEEGFSNLPETINRRWRDSDHLRKWALVETNWFDELEIELQSQKHADRLTKRLIEYAQHHGVYVKVIVEDKRVLIRTAQSQSGQAMGRADFEASKKDVLDLLEHMTNVPRGSLMREAGKHA